MSNENQNQNLDAILTEKELLDLLGIEKPTLDRLRYNAGLPFCKVTNRSRIYFVGKVLNWLETRSIVLNKHA